MTKKSWLVRALLLLGCCLALAQEPVVQTRPVPQPSRKSITVVLDDDYPPYIFRDVHGEFQGVLKDSWDLWQTKTGVEVRLLPMAWSAAQEMMRAGRADVIDTIFKTPERLALYDFTQPYATIDVPIFFHSSISGIVNADSLKGFTVGVKEGDACIEELTSHGVDHFKRYPSYSAVLGAARQGELRVFCMDQPPGVYLLHQLEMAQDYRTTSSISTGQFHRAVRKGDSAMLALVEKGFANITQEEAQQVDHKWFGYRIPRSGPGFIRTFRYPLIGAVLLAALLALWNLMLRSRVLEKTRVLSTALAELDRAKQVSDMAFKRLNGIAGNVPGMVYQFVLRPDGSSCFPYASDAIRQIYRLSPEEVEHDASAAFAIGHPDDVQAVIASIHESAKNLTPWKQEYRVKFADGTVRWLFGNAVPEALGNGEVLWHGLVTDITDAKVAESRFRQLSRAIEQAPIAVAITDLEGIIEYVNPRFSEVTGYTSEEAVGRNPRILQSGQTPVQTYEDMWNTLQRGEVWQGELCNRKKNGDLFIEYAVIAPVFDDRGVAKHYVALKQDVTQRRHDELVLQGSLKEKVALLHEVHHRVKNNLQVIISMLRLELRRTTDARTLHVLQDMQGRVHAMALLHETLYRAGNFASVELASYLRQLGNQIWRAHSGQCPGVQLVLELQPCTVSMDQATTCGLLVNELISNAFKHGFVDGRGGRVEVRSEPAEHAPLWALTVQDNGMGLPQDFDQRCGQSLGVQLSTDLARQLGGTLQKCSSTGAGFTVLFTPSLPPPAAA